MTDLTEQWKDGKLESGFYYVYLKHLGMFDITTSSTLFGILERGNENCLEILAPVPSYEEYKFASEQLNKNGTWYTERSYKELKKENDKLKERNDSLNRRDINLCRIANGIRDENFALKGLLKECRTIISENILGEYVIELCERITNAIGEK